jgi:hypothetical protein
MFPFVDYQRHGTTAVILVHMFKIFKCAFYFYFYFIFVVVVGKYVHFFFLSILYILLCRWQIHTYFYEF